MRTTLTILLSLISMLLEAQTVCQVRSFTIRDGLAANSIAGIDQDARGLIWIATWNGLCCYDGNQFTTFRASSAGDTLSTNRIAMIRCDSRSNVWLRTYDGGLYLFDTYQCRFVDIGKRIEQKYGQRIAPRNIYPLANGHTWISDEQGALNLRVDDRHATDMEHIEVYGTGGQALHGRYIRRVETDGQGREWVITDAGRWRFGSQEFHRGTDSTQRATTLDDERLSLLAEAGVQTAEIGKHFTDRQGNLWFTTPKGLWLATFRTEHVRQIPLVSGQQTRSVAVRRDGTVWAGTQDGHIAVIDSQQRLCGWLSPEGRISSRQVRFADRIYALYEDRQGSLWIGSKGKGRWRLEAEGRLESTGQPDAQVYDFCEDESGNVWTATFGGGVRHAATDELLQDYPADGFSRVRRISYGSQGRLWASTTEGLVVRDKKGQYTRYGHHAGDATSLLTSDVMQALVTHNGDCYVATLGGGIQRLTNDRWQTIGDGTPAHPSLGVKASGGNVLSIAEDPKGCLWIVREGGIDRYQPLTGVLQQMSLGTTAKDAELVEAKSAITADGRLWVGTVGGLITFDTGEMLLSEYRPDIVFTSVRYQGERESQPILNIPILTVTPDRRSLTISFAALDYTDNYLMRYAYRMDDDEEWSYIDTPHIAFSQLSPGRHRLTVRSTNSDGVWTDNGTRLIIDVTPTLWERGWMRLLLLLTAIGLCTWMVIAWLRRRQQNREREARLMHIMQQYRELQEKQADREAQEEQADREAQEEQQKQETQPTKPVYTLSEPVITDPDEEMMNHLMAFIEEHLQDENLRIEEMAEAVNLGRTVFYEKIRQLVGLSPSDFLRQVRMQRARQLVAKSKMTFSQIAYSVGFTDPKYFTKCFKKDTGMTPSDYRSANA